MDKYKGLHNVAYLCQKMSIIGGVVWVLNAIFFFIQYFSEGMKIPDVRSLMQSYGGALIAAIVPILMLYAVGGLIYLLIDIESNTRK
jgi:hypothetical protein